MPASRSRTERWRESLWKIYERGGGLEFTVDRTRIAEQSEHPASEVKDLVWRVRVLGLEEDSIAVEVPGAMGRSFRFETGTPLLGIMSVGQNRWMFHTEVTGKLKINTRNGTTEALRVAMPERVERCQRRSFDRISSASLQLPSVECWPLLDPRTAVAPEVANRCEILDAADGDLIGSISTSRDPAALPEVGPGFDARMANIGGGGIGLYLDKGSAAAVDSGRMFWLRVDLRPVIHAPITMTGKMVHRHMDSSQNVYVGMAFEFGYNPGHKAFVVDQIDRYLSALQSMTLRKAG